MKTQLDSIERRTALLRTFANKYADRIGDDKLHCSADYGECMVNVFFKPIGGAAHFFLLHAAGDTWGRDGWTATVNHDRTAYHWQKMVDGVKVTLRDVVPIMDADAPRELPPSAFPDKDQDGKTEPAAVTTGESQEVLG